MSFELVGSAVVFLLVSRVCSVWRSGCGVGGRSSCGLTSASWVVVSLVGFVLVGSAVVVLCGLSIVYRARSRLIIYKARSRLISICSVWLYNFGRLNSLLERVSVAVVALVGLAHG